MFLWKDCTSSISERLLTEQVLPHNLGFTRGGIRAVPQLSFSHIILHRPLLYSLELSSTFSFLCSLSPILPFLSGHLFFLDVCICHLRLFTSSSLLDCWVLPDPHSQSQPGAGIPHHWPEPQCWVCLCQTFFFFFLKGKGVRSYTHKTFYKKCSPSQGVLWYCVFSFHKLDL